jgi:hypothetical protein
VAVFRVLTYICIHVTMTRRFSYLITVFLYFCFSKLQLNSRLLRIKIIQAKDLSKDLFGSTDTFVQVVLCKKNNDTSVIEFLKTSTVKKVSAMTM